MIVSDKKHFVTRDVGKGEIGEGGEGERDKSMFDVQKEDHPFEFLATDRLLRA